MKKTREQIEQNIKALQQELKELPPKELQVVIFLDGTHWGFEDIKDAVSAGEQYSSIQKGIYAYRLVES